MARTVTVGKPSSSDSGTGRVVVALTGELDLATASRLARLADVSTRREVRQLILDLAHLEFCDVAGVRALLTLQATLTRHGVKLVLANAPEPVTRVMAVTRLDLYFTVAPSPSRSRGARHGTFPPRATPPPPVARFTSDTALTSPEGPGTSLGAH